MKKFILFLLMTNALCNIAAAQNKVIVYCKMTITELSSFNGKLKERQQVVIDYGTTAISPIFNDTSALVKLIKTKTMTNGIDAMNYMNSIGWELINITSKFSDYTCFYKKELDK